MSARSKTKAIRRRLEIILVRVHLQFVVESITANVFDRLESSTDGRLLALYELGMTPREDLHARLVAKNERFVVVTSMRPFGYDILNSSDNSYVPTTVNGRSADDLRWRNRLSEGKACAKDK